MGAIPLPQPSFRNSLSDLRIPPAFRNQPAPFIVIDPEEPMKPRILTFALALFALALAACQPAAPGALPYGQVVRSLGESIASADGSIGVSFIEVVEDSRCPADAICITSGSVRVLVQVTLGTESFQPTLTLGDMLAGGGSSLQGPQPLPT